MVKNSKIPLADPVFNKEMKKAVIDAYQNERWLLGESVYKFEEEFAKYCETDYAISTNSGTTALHLSLIATGINNLNEVITTPASFVATANCIQYVGAKPTFADINILNYTIDPKQIAKNIIQKTKAIIPVHLYGYPSNMDEIKDVIGHKQIFVIEDACQAHGAEFFGKKVGAIGDIGCFSFYPSKNITVCGDGGMITTNNEKIAKILIKLRDCGRVSKYVHDVIGYTARLNTANAAIGRIQLKYLDIWNKKRRKNAQRYSKILVNIPELILPPCEEKNIKPAFYQYVIRTKKRDLLKDYLNKHNIECSINYPLPIHLQPIYKKLFNYKEGMYPNSELLSDTCLSIPMHQSLDTEQITFIGETIKNFMNIY
jgi:perosamine synthetase